jgi:OOP family OmpA-OmpF porin
MGSILSRLAFLVLILCHISTFGYSNTFTSADSLTRVSGQVYDSTIQSPIGGAILSYEEMPYGNIVGIVKTEEPSGHFEFMTYEHKSYRIEVKKEKYNTHIEILSPVNHAVEGQYKKDFYINRIPSSGDILKLKSLIFEQGKSEITGASYFELDGLVNKMKEKPSMIIQLEGHTDFHGSRTKNMELSEDRVVAVKNYLIQKGLKKNRIFTKAFGGSNPISKETSEEAARLNRRVEVRILQI